MNEDSYGSTIREAMKRSMAEPFTPRNRRVSSWWDQHSEEIGLILWIFACTLGGSALWLALDGTEKWFR